MAMNEFEALETPELKRRLDDGDAMAWSLKVLMAGNVLFWLVVMLSPQNAAGLLGDPSAGLIYGWGGLNTQAVMVHGEYWRLITGPFLHASWWHLLGNLAFLWIYGRYAVRWYGNVQFLLLYLLSALAGATASLYFAARVGVAVGASGALFGVVAAMLVSTFQHEGVLSDRHYLKLSGSYGLFLAIGVGSGFFDPFIDNAAHVGGGMMGAYLGWFLIERFEAGEQRQRSMEQRAAAVLPVVMVFALAFLLFR